MVIVHILFKFNIYIYIHTFYFIEKGIMCLRRRNVTESGPSGFKVLDYWVLGLSKVKIKSMQLNLEVGLDQLVKTGPNKKVFLNGVPQ